MFERLSFTTRMFTGFLAMVVLVILQGVISWHGISTVSSDIQTITTTTPRTDNLMTILALLGRIERNQIALGNHEISPQEREKLMKENARYTGDYEKIWSVYTDIAPLKGERKLRQEITALMAELKKSLY